MDERRRELERKAAAGDQITAITLAYSRCKSGECCGHKTGLPAPDPEALKAFVIISDVRHIHGIEIGHHVVTLRVSGSFGLVS